MHQANRHVDRHRIKKQMYWAMKFSAPQLAAVLGILCFVNPQRVVSSPPSGLPSSLPMSVSSAAPSTIPSDTPTYVARVEAGASSDVPSTIPSDTPTQVSAILSFSSDDPSDTPSISSDRASSTPSDLPSELRSDRPTEAFTKASIDSANVRSPSDSPSKTDVVDRSSNYPSSIPSSFSRIAASDKPSGMPRIGVSEFPSDAPSKATEVLVGSDTIAKLLAERQEWSFFYNSTLKTGLLETMDTRDKGSDFLTVIVSNDESWSQIPEDFKSSLSMNAAFLPHFRVLLAYHAIPVAYSTSDIVNNTFVISAAGEELLLQTTNDPSTMIVNVLQTIESNIAASNGIIHVVNSGVLAPSWLFNSIGQRVILASFLSSFLKLMTIGGLPFTNAGELTLLAPTNDGIASSLSDSSYEFLITAGNEATTMALVAYHVIQGIYTTEDFVSNALYPTILQDTSVNVTRSTNDEAQDGLSFNSAAGIDTQARTKNLLANNGIIHCIDAVLIPNGLPLE
jgi:uncharacterized surface protein with fasciclin (FAS1) repeats